MSPRPTRVPRARPPKRGWKGWPLVFWGSLLVAHTVFDWIAEGRFPPFGVPFLLAGVVLICISGVPGAVGRRRTHDPGWTRTSGHSIATHFMDAEESEWETMRRRTQERRMRREQRAREREARGDDDPVL